MDRDHMRSVQSCRRVGFPAEPPLKVLVLRQIRRQNFDGDDAIGHGVMRAPHLAHAAATQQPHQAVATERRPVRSVLPCHDQDASDSHQPAQSIR